MTRALDTSRGKDYFTKAENSLRMAKIAIQEKAYDNAVMSAIHSSINALDALTTSYLGKRASGEHTNTLALIKGILPQKEYSETAKQFSSLMSLKNTSEYQPNLMSQSDAETSVKWAERIISRVREKIEDLENS